ncbi:MAG: hypothetical protein J5483_04655 [Lachnospiraceae bacterium]|nr:hypothetical protein [Lachnospiraceae bacterium]
MIFLTILKIIGIVLACIVGFILLLVLVVLFAPIRYRLSGAGENTDMKADGEITWIFGLLTASAAYQELDVSYRVSVLGFDLKKGSLKEHPESKEKEESASSPEPSSQETMKPTEEQTKPEPPKEQELEIEMIDISDAVTKPAPGTKEKEDFSDKIDRFCEKISAKYEKFRLKLEQAETILTSEVTKRAVKTVKEQLFHILDHIKPKKIEGFLNFGLEDPANTAIIYGTIDILAESMSQGKLIITPEFYQKGISLDMKISGRIFLGKLALCALRVFFNRDVRKVVRVIRRVI